MSTWHGLQLQFSCGHCGSGPGLRPDFCIEELELVKVEDEQEFREHHPVGTPAEVFAKHEQEIEEALYQEVLDNDDGPDPDPD